jgi:hypothetical protein
MTTELMEAPAATETECEPTGVAIPPRLLDAFTALEKERNAFYRRIDNTPRESQPVNGEWIADDGMVGALDRVVASAARQVDEEGIAPRGCAKLYSALETFARAWLAFSEATDGYDRPVRSMRAIPSNVWGAVDAVGNTINELSRPIPRKPVENLEQLFTEGVTDRQCALIHGLEMSDVTAYRNGRPLPSSYIPPEQIRYEADLRERNKPHDASALLSVAALLSALRRKEAAEQ